MDYELLRKKITNWLKDFMLPTEDKEDITQDVLITVFEKEVAGKQMNDAYLMALTRCRAIDRYRKLSKQKTCKLEDIENYASYDISEALIDYLLNEGKE